MATYDLAYPGAAIDAILNTSYFLQEAGYIFQGSASEYSGTPSKRVWLIAPAGSTGFGLSSAVPQGSFGICLYNGTSWVGKIINVATIDSVPTQNSGNAVSSGGAYAAINQLSASVTEALENLTFTDTTPSAFQDEYINMKVSTTEGGVERILTYLTILAATTSKAGLLSAEDKVKIDSFLANLRSLTFADTTASADQSTQITETLKATIGGVQEVIDSITLLAATSSKAGLLSASDKAYIDALPATLTNLSNSISGALALMQSLVGYYVCDTAAGNAAKIVAATGYSLTNGGCIRIKMTNANTANNVTLNINSTGAKALYYDGTQASATNTWEAGEVLEVYYDGTQYQCASGGGGKFATGQKVKDTSITDEVVADSEALPTSGAVEKRIEGGNYSSSTKTIIDVTKKTWLNANVNDAGFDTVIPVDNTGYCTTGYVDIAGYREIEITIISKCQRNEINGKMGYIFYNEEYVPISSAVTNSAGTYALKTIKLSVPEGAQYIRFSCYPGNTNIVLWKYYPFLNVNDVVNNLEDGGETKALSAEMGKELAVEMDNVTNGIQSYKEMGENCFDISEQTTDQTTAENLSCTKTETGYSFVCAGAAVYKYAYGTVKGLTIGEKYEIVFDYTRDLKVSSTYAGLLRMMYEKPLQDITYGLVAWILKNYPPSGTIRYTFTAEYSTYYLRMAANDIGTGGSVTLSNIRVVNLAKSDYIKSIVDSTIGLPDSGVDTASVKGYYNGNRIPSIEGGSYEIGYTKVCNSAGQVDGQTIQACAAYNGYLFEFLNRNSAVHIYNLAASTPVLHSTVTPTNISTGHCNTACFGSKKYDDADIFPLLYTSGGQTQDYNQVQVYRVTFENDVFTITQVQNITMPATTNVNKFYWAQIYLDNELNDMWYVGNGEHARWVKFKIPEIKDDGGNVISSVVLTDEDGQDEFYTLGFVHQQGGIIVNGYCYIMDGVPAWGDTAYMRVFDVWAKKMINYTVDLTRIGWSYEPEGIGLYDNHFYVNTAGNGIFKFFF